MAMPETPVNENGSAMPGKNYVRLAWKIFAVEAKSKAKRMQKRANAHLGFSIAIPNRRHIAVALFGSMYICHVVKCFAVLMNSPTVTSSTGLSSG